MPSFETLADAERKRWLSEILARLAPSENSERNDKMLTWDQIRCMKRQGIDFGGHTVTHPFSSRLSPDQMRWEASECKARIEDELQSSVKHFAYPSGREQDFAEWNKKVIYDAGYEAAVSTLWGINYPATDPDGTQARATMGRKVSSVCGKTRLVSGRRRMILSGGLRGRYVQRKEPRKKRQALR